MGLTLWVQDLTEDLGFIRQQNICLCDVKKLKNVS